MRIGRWMIVHGVNLLVPHSAWDTIRGARKGDHPQNFGPQSRWFKYLRPLNDEFARLCWIANQGECVNRVLVIDSLTSAFCASRKAESSEPTAVAALANACTESAEASLPSILPLKHAADQFSQDLSDAQVDYDLGDEYVIEEFGAASREGFVVGRRTYPLVVLMPGLHHLRSHTVEKLGDFLKMGGEVGLAAVREFFVDGMPSDALAALGAAFPGQVHVCDDADGLRRFIVGQVPPRLILAGDTPVVGVAHMHRAVEEGEIVLLVNSTPMPLSTRLILSTSRKMLRRLDPATGESVSLAGKVVPLGLEIPVEVPATGALVLYASDDPDDQGEAVVPGFCAGTNRPEREVEFLRAERLEDNILAVDFCSLEIRGREFPMEDAMATNHRYWKAHGMDTHGWNNVIQYRDQILARDRRMLPDSGGVVRYPVEIAPETNRDIRLVV
jgi:hypothetical protein